MSLEDYLFDDEKMREFIVNGYCVLKVDLPREFHDQIFEKTQKILDEEGNPGNNILPRIPEVQHVFDQPVVQGALTSILGPNHVMHVHRFAHGNDPGGKGGGWHKDSYWGHNRMRDHHPRWIMAMYYPQDTPIELGPTGTIPGSQYFDTRVPTLPLATDTPVDPDGIGLPAVGEAGTVLLIHFDLWHRAFPNYSDQKRYMFKFQFTRLDEPTRPYWNQSAAEIPLESNEGSSLRSPIWRQMWQWMMGNSEWTTEGDPDTLQVSLSDSSEEVRLNAAYLLGGLGEAGRAVLTDALHETARVEVQRAACYGLAATGIAAIPDLVQALKSENEQTRALAVYALGDMGAKAAETLPALIALCDDPSRFVRYTLADALGQIRSLASLSVPALSRLLTDADAQVRFNAAYGLAKFRADATPAITTLSNALEDNDRYVRGHATIALEQIGSPEALRILLHHYQTTRWCALTTPASSF